VGDILLNVKLIVLEAQKAKYQSYSSDRTCALLDGMSFTVLFSEDVLKVIATLDSLVLLVCSFWLTELRNSVVHLTNHKVRINKNE
jgi:hypothetical protein